MVPPRAPVCGKGQKGSDTLYADVPCGKLGNSNDSGASVLRAGYVLTWVALGTGHSQSLLKVLRPLNPQQRAALGEAEG